MGYSIYKVGNRWAGYGVPATCEYPTCKNKIDRGVSYACGGEPFSDVGCDRYFCEKHLNYNGWNEKKGEWCRHQEDCKCETYEVCERCESNQPPFEYKPERSVWVKHLLKDKSWAEWREKNPEEVKKLLANLSAS